ncbi:MAG: hypothetical protein LBD50_03910 [Rickettsiales bacterium]|jgi:hypothetical protein|nr:hypothetical protein [Rickettsiales bacterium]
MKKLFAAIIAVFPMLAFGNVDLIARRAELEKQIELVDSEIARCKKQQKNWKIATIVGSVGTVATGIGAIAQQSAINENKKDIDLLKKRSDANMKIILDNKQILKEETEALEGVTK